MNANYVLCISLPFKSEIQGPCFTLIFLLFKTIISSYLTEKRRICFSFTSKYTSAKFLAIRYICRYNIRDRAVLNTIPQSEVGRFYEVYKLFGSEINNKTNEFWLKLHPGCVIFIDNWRVLHGRASYTGKRHLCGCYISRTEWMSKARALRLLWKYIVHYLLTIMKS